MTPILQHQLLFSKGNLCKLKFVVTVEVIFSVMSDDMTDFIVISIFLVIFLASNSGASPVGFLSKTAFRLLS